MCAADFNQAHLEQFINDVDTKHYLGYTLKDKIKSITMKRIKKVDKNGAPYMKIIIESYSHTLKMTRKVCNYLDDFISGQLSDGCGKHVFHPYNSFMTEEGPTCQLCYIVYTVSSI